MRRRSDGAPLRAAIADAGLSVRKLAQATKELDPEGRGVSPATIGKITTTACSGAAGVRESNARLIAEALHKPVSALFVDDVISMTTKSTSTRRQKTLSGPEEPGTPVHESMIDTQTLAGLIKKSTKWIYAQAAAHPVGSANPWPVHYAGKSPRYLYSEVRAWMRASAVAA